MPSAHTTHTTFNRGDWPHTSTLVVSCAPICACASTMVLASKTKSTTASRRIASHKIMELSLATSGHPVGATGVMWKGPSSEEKRELMPEPHSWCSEALRRVPAQAAVDLAASPLGQSVHLIHEAAGCGSLDGLRRRPDQSRYYQLWPQPALLLMSIIFGMAVCGLCIYRLVLAPYAFANLATRSLFDCRSECGRNGDGSLNTVRAFVAHCRAD